jgi:small nuclear ribonucleoprotein (snRNP)-like protein
MRVIATVLILSMLSISASAAFAQQSESSSWRQVAEAIPLGSRVKVQLTDGKRVSGTLMRVDGAEVLVKRNTRRPEPAVAIAFDQMSRLERDHGNGTNVGKAIAIGLASGAGVILGLFVLALQFD